MKIKFSENSIDGYVILLASIISIPLFVCSRDSILLRLMLMPMFIFLIIGRFVVYKSYVAYLLSKKYQTVRGFVKEIIQGANTSNKNVVANIGYQIKGKEAILKYEFHSDAYLKEGMSVFVYLPKVDFYNIKVSIWGYAYELFSQIFGASILIAVVAYNYYWG